MSIGASVKAAISFILDEPKWVSGDCAGGGVIGSSRNARPHQRAGTQSRLGGPYLRPPAVEVGAEWASDFLPNVEYDLAEVETR